MLTRRQFLKGCTGAAVAVAGLSFFSGNRILDQLTKSIPILLYHRVGPESDPLTVSTQRFQQDMEFLSWAGYHSLSLEQVRQHIEAGATLPDKPLLITFDDGYLDNYTNAFPILQQYAMKASFYIITGMVGQANRMSAAQIREMTTAGMDFGSHTVTHRPLAGLTLDEAGTELKNSKYDLEQMMGKSVNFTAYPCGSYNPEVLDIAKETGYVGGFSTRYGFAGFSNNLAIRRIPIFHSDRSISYVMFKKGFIPTMFG
jgi:peptidoglycan/xylan/chitin deacetylase (PgdA/CDA1 family)